MKGSASGLAWFPRVTEAHPAQDECFQPFHLSGLTGMVVVVASKVQEPMYDQMSCMCTEAFAGLLGFSPHGLVSEDDIPAQHGSWWLECQDVGGLVLASELGIEPFDMLIVSKDEGRRWCVFQKDMAITLGHDTGPLNELLYVAQCSPPAWIRDQNLSVRSGRAFHDVSGRNSEDQVPCRQPADRKLRQYGRQGGDGLHQLP